VTVARVNLYWEFEGDDVREAGALPPEPLALPVASAIRPSPFHGQDYAAQTIGR
jgi:hypothetical protein